MSFPRAKVTRFNEKPGRPATAINTNFNSTSQRSLIPKFRSLSQPPSMQSIKEGTNTDETKETVKEVECTINPSLKSVKSDEFKDCLDVKSHNSSVKQETADFFDKSSATVIEKEIKEEKTIKKETKTTCRKNSASGIPVCCPKSPLKNSPTKNTPRINQSMSVPKRAQLNTGTTNDRVSSLPNKRNMDLFIAKKKRFDLLKKEIMDKQKPLLDLYQNLQQLKKKLEENGKTVTFDSVNIVEYDNGNKSNVDPSAGGETLLVKIDLDQTFLTEIKNNIKEIPQNLYKVCTNLMNKRNDLLSALDESADPSNEDKSEIENLKTENSNLDAVIRQTFEDQENVINEIVNKLSNLSNGQGAEKIVDVEMQAKLKKQETQVKQLTSELAKLKLQLRDKSPKREALEDENRKLVEKTVTLERQLDNEKRKLQNETDKLRNTESSLKTLKLKAKELETQKHEHESKINQLSHDLRNSHIKIKQVEKGYEKEILELNKARHLDKSTIERLNKDHSTFETRLRTANDGIEYAQKREKELIEQIDQTKNENDLKHTEITELKKEIANLHRQMVVYETQARQNADILTRRQEIGDNNLEIDKECELQVEICSQRAAIKALQEKLEVSATEKMRFMASVDKYSGPAANDKNETLLKTIIKQNDDLTKFERKINMKNEIIEEQKAQIEKLSANEKNLSDQLESLSTTSNEESDELKNMLKEGKTKLEQALMKSLENEHKIIKYEHELSQKNQALANLENMMRLREGLVSVIKKKKDELAYQNHSLKKYSDETRDLMSQAKEEIKSKIEIILELKHALNTKITDNHHLETKTRELEDKLIAVNDKRFKLQETVTYMEKELQATKAQLNQIEDMQTRYDLGRISSESKTFESLPKWNTAGQEINFSDPGDGPVKIKITVI